jgi:hypothetical protein
VPIGEVIMKRDGEKRQGKDIFLQYIYAAFCFLSEVVQAKAPSCDISTCCVLLRLKATLLCIPVLQAETSLVISHLLEY